MTDFNAIERAAEAIAEARHQAELDEADRRADREFEEALRLCREEPDDVADAVFDDVERETMWSAVVRDLARNSVTESHHEDAYHAWRLREILWATAKDMAREVGE